MSENVRELSFEEEADLYREEVLLELAKETTNADSDSVNNILRRGMRIIRKAREEMAKMRPIRYGSWVVRPCGGVATWYCSDCEKEIPFGCHADDLKFCPYCGSAKDRESCEMLPIVPPKEGE